MSTIQMYQSHNNKLLQLERSILVLKFNDIDIVASPLDLKSTIEWYKKEFGEENPVVTYVDIEKDGLWLPVPTDDEEYDELDFLGYIDGVIELVRYSTSDKFGNVRYVDGEICRYTSFKDYCNKFIRTGKELKGPEIIASTEV